MSRKVVNISGHEEIPLVAAEESAKGNSLVEIQDHFDGKHVVFEVPETSEVVAELQEQVKALQAKVNELEQKQL